MFSPRNPELLDLQGAREMQSRFFPARLQHIQGLDYSGECRPAGEVGGDFFDFTPLGRDALLVSVGDVCGKGVGAAILMAGIQGFLRGVTTDGCPALSTVVREMNRITHEVSPDNIFATLFYACVNPLRGQLQYVSAGHEPALLVRRDSARINRLESTGTVLGLSARTEFATRTVLLDPGDTLIAFTDGITEAADAEGRELRDLGVLDVVLRHPEAPANVLVARIMEAAARLTGVSGTVDDRTVAVVRYTGLAEQGSALELAVANA